jgi:hypothetical protein
MHKILRKLFFLSLFCFCLAQVASAQFTVSGQIRTRSEYRNGQGTPQAKDTIPAFFTSQRTRLNFGYSGYRFKVFAAVQDVRVWGQDGSTINRFTTDSNDGFMLHEAWGEISLVDTGKVVKNFSVKIGRQELVYDDVRLLGNLDWLQQARRHDAILFKFEHKGWIAHLGGAFNQNAERKSNIIYNGAPAGAYPASTNGLASTYKSLQFLYLAKKLHFGTVSFIGVKDDFSKFHFAPADVTHTTPIYERHTWSRYTYGINFFGTAFRKLAIAGSAFSQVGKYRDGTKLNEALLSLSASYAITRKLSAGPGVDYTSGNNGTDPKSANRRFDPLYGTPHKFWGYMDYFYVADGFKSNGLVDYYFKMKFKAKDNLTLSLDSHEFVLPSAVMGGDGKYMKKGLGTEFDFVINYAMTKSINIEGGYSQMYSTSTMLSTKVKGTAKLNDKTASKNSDWAYLMISIKPEFLFKN